VTKAAEEVQYVSREKLAQIFDCTPRWISRLAEEGMPKVGRGRFDLARCMLWFIRYQARIINRRENGPEGQLKRIREHQIDLLNAKAAAAEHELGKLNRDYLDAKEVDRAWGLIAAAIKERVLADYKRVAPSLEGESREVIAAKLQDQARETLTALAAMKIVDDGGQ
jgi:phage terminase Nu1 subunit (DNA packaging protein)